MRGTTLAAPAWWALASVASLATIEVFTISGLVAAAHSGAFRYAAAVTVLCPMMAVLGAKRPQDRAWQWVVAALLATLWLPAAKALLLDGGAMHLFPAWQVFVGILVLLGPLNYLPTGNWLPALLVTAGQTLLLAAFLPLLNPRAGEWRLPAAMTCFLVAGLIVRLRTWRVEQRPGHADSWRALNTEWFRFRDAFGAFWGVRVVQRVNQGLHAAGSSLELTWTGWAGAGPSPASEEDLGTAIQRATSMLRTVLRRFVRRA